MRRQAPFDTHANFFTFEEYQKLLDFASAERWWYAAILCAGDAGLRMGEIIETSQAVQENSNEHAFLGCTPARSFPLRLPASTRPFPSRLARGELPLCERKGRLPCT